MLQETYATSFVRPSDKEQCCNDVPILRRHSYKNMQPFAELGNAPVPLEQFTSIKFYRWEVA
jgi:hypothetical protein